VVEKRVFGRIAAFSSFPQRNNIPAFSIWKNENPLAGDWRVSMTFPSPQLGQKLGPSLPSGWIVYLWRDIIFWFSHSAVAPAALSQYDCHFSVRLCTSLAAGFQKFGIVVRINFHFIRGINIMTKFTLNSTDWWDYSRVLGNIDISRRMVCKAHHDLWRGHDWILLRPRAYAIVLEFPVRWFSKLSTACQCWTGSISDVPHFHLRKPMCNPRFASTSFITPSLDHQLAPACPHHKRAILRRWGKWISHFLESDLSFQAKTSATSHPKEATCVSWPQACMTPVSCPFIQFALTRRFERVNPSFVTGRGPCLLFRGQWTRLSPRNTPTYHQSKATPSVHLNTQRAEVIGDFFWRFWFPDFPSSGFCWISRPHRFTFDRWQKLAVYRGLKRTGQMPSGDSIGEV